MGALVVVIAVIALTGCGGSSSSDDQNGGPYLDVMDVVEIGPYTSDAVKAINGIYAVWNEARNAKDVHKRATILRERVPPVVDTFQAAYQPTIDRLEAFPVRSAPGDELRRIETDIIKEWRQALSTLRRELATSKNPWQAMVTFDHTNNGMVRRFGQRVSTLVANLSAPEQQMARTAVRQMFGG